MLARLGQHEGSVTKAFVNVTPLPMSHRRVFGMAQSVSHR
jgi:hypothetical protein